MKINAVTTMEAMEFGLKLLRHNKNCPLSWQQMTNVYPEVSDVMMISSQGGGLLTQTGGQHLKQIITPEKYLRSAKTSHWAKWSLCGW